MLKDLWGKEVGHITRGGTRNILQYTSCPEVNICQSHRKFIHVTVKGGRHSGIDDIWKDLKQLVLLSSFIMSHCYYEEYF